MAAIEERVNVKGIKSYRVKVRIKGYPVQTATFNTKTDAKAWARNTESAIHEGRYFSFSASKKKTMADLIDRYIEEILPTKPASMIDQTRHLEYWKKEIGDLVIQDLTPSMIVAVRNKLRSQKTVKPEDQRVVYLLKHFELLNPYDPEQYRKKLPALKYLKDQNLIGHLYKIEYYIQNTDFPCFE